MKQTITHLKYRNTYQPIQLRCDIWRYIFFVWAADQLMVCVQSAVAQRSAVTTHSELSAGKWRDALCSGSHVGRCKASPPCPCLFNLTVSALTTYKYVLASTHQKIEENLRFSVYVLRTNGITAANTPSRSTVIFQNQQHIFWVFFMLRSGCVFSF